MAIDIGLERNQYAAGETVKGTLIISAEKDFQVRGFEFSVSGEERVEMKLEESYGINAYYGINATTTTYKESDIFFSKDLSHFLNSIGTKMVDEHDDDNNNIILEVAAGNWKVHFEFSIPGDARSLMMVNVQR